MRSAREKVFWLEEGQRRWENLEESSGGILFQEPLPWVMWLPDRVIRIRDGDLRQRGLSGTSLEEMEDSCLLNTCWVQVMLKQPHPRERQSSIVFRLLLSDEYFREVGSIKPLMPPMYDYSGKEEEGKMEGGK